MNKVRELKIDSTLWATPARIINLLDFNPEKLTIDKELNSIHNTPDASSVYMSIYFFINNLIGYIEEIDGSSDKYLNKRL